MSYLAEYIWLDGTEPTQQIRSKTKVVALLQSPPIWGFDGSSTGQAFSSDSDCVLSPVFDCPDPLRGDPHRLVLCEVQATDLSPHPTNTRVACLAVHTQFASHQPLFGIEQEYTFFQADRPLGWPALGYPAPQGPYYCGVGGTRMPGRQIVEQHTRACLAAGLSIEGTNAEVMMGQWEFQIGVLPAPLVADQLIIARYLLLRIAEDYQVDVSFAAKPIAGDWNGAGAHTNFSTAAMRAPGGITAIIAGCEALADQADEHVTHYGHDIASRLTGAHETAPYTEFSYGHSDRSASVRIPWGTTTLGSGWLEDRRPNANMDPYTVTRLITRTVCSCTPPA